jgi:hypothetical protein
VNDTSDAGLVNDTVDAGLVDDTSDARLVDDTIDAIHGKVSDQVAELLGLLNVQPMVAAFESHLQARGNTQLHQKIQLLMQCNSPRAGAMPLTPAQT